MIRRLGPTMTTMALLFACLTVGCARQGGVPPGEGAEIDVTVLPELIQGLKLRDPTAQVRSAVTIGRIGPAARDAVPALIEALKDRDLSVRAAAAYSLGQIGPDARQALPGLKSLKTPASLREIAANAIQRIGT